MCCHGGIPSQVITVSSLVFVHEDVTIVSLLKAIMEEMKYQGKVECYVVRDGSTFEGKRFGSQTEMLDCYNFTRGLFFLMILSMFYWF